MTKTKVESRLLLERSTTFRGTMLGTFGSSVVKYRRGGQFVPVAAAAFLAIGAQPGAAKAQDTSKRTGEAWQIIPLAQSSLVYGRDGSPIGEIGREMRTSVPIRSVPKYVPQAFVAVEDQRFYQHDGV